MLVALVNDFLCILFRTQFCIIDEHFISYGSNVHGLLRKLHCHRVVCAAAGDDDSPMRVSEEKIGEDVSKSGRFSVLHGAESRQEVSHRSGSRAHRITFRILTRPSSHGLSSQHTFHQKCHYSHRRSVSMIIYVLQRENNGLEQ